MAITHQHAHVTKAWASRRNRDLKNDLHAALGMPNEFPYSSSTIEAVLSSGDAAGAPSFDTEESSTADGPSVHRGK